MYPATQPQQLSYGVHANFAREFSATLSVLKDFHDFDMYAFGGGRKG
jgi:hypothetical protein